MNTYTNIRHLAALVAWLVTVAACLALLLPATGSLTRLLPTLANVTHALTTDAPTAVSSLQPVEHLPHVAAVVPPSIHDEPEAR